ncbi:MAG TPA: beta-ketoacyl-[acyl-carrier-protein] synthase family protein [Chitinivibrionales bacterium]|nr:beta-ketoacyl-[acyl-carrier-protein] synthase family protein [Chitinivibrionales bacterium]
MPRRVVITGMGPVTSIGIGKDAFWRSLLRKGIVVSPVPEAFERTCQLHSRWYAPLPAVSLGDYGMDFHFASAMQPEDRMAVAGAKLALDDAGFPLERTGAGLAVKDLGSCSVLIGTGLSGLQSAFESYLAHRLPQELLDRLAVQKRIKFNRMVIPATMPNSPAAWVSICFGVHGQSATINASCASGTCAVGEAFRRIRDGYDDTVLCGGVENLRDESGAIMRGFDILGTLTKSKDGPPRPFSKNRSGFLFAEGAACLLVMEALERARSRKARVYAEVLDYRACSDAANIVQIEKEGRQIARMLAEISRGRHIDYLNAHGTGTEPNDDVEARAVASVFGARAEQPLVNSTKGILGHTLGASGALEAAVTALSLTQGVVHGNLTDDPVEGLNLPLEPVTRPIRTALTVSYGFGGHNAALLLGKVP